MYTIGTILISLLFSFEVQDAQHTNRYRVHRIYLSVKTFFNRFLLHVETNKFYTVCIIITEICIILEY